ncbi:hypothetical protein A4X09_0g5659 [Tilletia walkeri]|uniref:Uncharacterized protein n=1 Tax=Tilletia walkeri TaxID=117179 RepID=A0A8X7T2N9_9BASI|nr:hypothetical protein A4X09_0g5659 [Tilletia walkeri]
MAASRLIKWPTHLAITVDVILGNADSVDNVHKVDSTIHDSEGTAAEAKTHLWSRMPPKEGAYIVTQPALATSPLRFNINDPENMRLIPEALRIRRANTCLRPFPSSTASASSRPSNPITRGVSSVASYYSTRAWLGRVGGWRPLRRFIFPQGDIETILRRVTSLDSAPQGLLSALAIGTAGSSGRAARIREVRATKVKRQMAESSDPFTAAPVGDPEKAITDFKLPTVTGIVTRAGAAAGPPSSPSPAPKKQRGHVQ